MTVEEKALYLDRANKYWYQNTNIIGLYSKESELDVKNAYIDGLAEGRKELEQCKQDLQIAIDTNKKWLQRDTQLEEENEELKAQILGLQNNIDGQKARKYHHIKENVKLNGKVEELKERLRIESQSLHEQCEIVSKQVEQIEKMKNCLNCRFEYPLCNECNGCGENYKHWELAE